MSTSNASVAMQDHDYSNTATSTRSHIGERESKLIGGTVIRSQWAPLLILYQLTLQLSPPRSNSVNLHWIRQSLQTRHWHAVVVSFSPHGLSLPVRPMARHSLQMKWSVKILLGKEEKTYLLRNVFVSDVYSIELMKCFLSHTFGIEDVQEFGYFVKRRKVWLREVDELSTVVRTLLVKGKGTLWCTGKWANAELTQPHETPAG